MKKLLLLATSFIILSACQKDPQLIKPAMNDGTKATAPTTMLTQTNSTTTASGKTKRSSSEEGGITYCGPVTTVSLLAGQTINVGTVSVANNTENLFVTYNITDASWRMNDLSLYVGDCNQIPRNKSGNPIPGHFPFKTTFSSTGLLSYTFTIPLNSLPGCYCVAAHATVSKGGGSETAWGAGTRFVRQGNWGTYFSTCRNYCEG